MLFFRRPSFPYGVRGYNQATLFLPKGKPVNKTLFIFSLLLLPAFSSAEVKIYGELKSGVEASRTKSGGRSVSGTQVSDFGSYVGLRGSHSIGGSASPNKVLWQWGQDAPTASDKRSGSLRETFRSRKQSGESYVGFGRDK